MTKYIFMCNLETNIKDILAIVTSYSHHKLCFIAYTLFYERIMIMIMILSITEQQIK